MTKEIKPSNECASCNGSGDNYYSCCGDDMRGNDLDICPTCFEHTGWDGESDGDCQECNGLGIVDLK